MTTNTNLEELQRLVKKVTGQDSRADNIADAICELANGYSGGGSGVSVVSGQINIDGSSTIKSASLTMSDGSVIDMALTSIDNLSLSRSAGTSEGNVIITVAESIGKGNSYVYGIDISPSKPAKHENMSHLAPWDGKSEIAAFQDSVVTIVEIDKNKLAVKAGTITV